MPTIVLGLVTIFHPDVYLPDLLALPHIRHSRRERISAMKEFAHAGRVTLTHSYRDTPTLDSGQEQRRFRHKIVSGATLLPVLADPRIIHVFDEPPPRAKWKIEIRKNWPDSTGLLPGATKEQLRNALVTAELKIKGLWINPTLDQTKWSNPRWVNLVLVALRHSEPGAPAALRLCVVDGRLCVSWEESD